MPELPSPVEILRAIGDIGESALPAALGRLPNNTHIHLPPNFSAFDSVAEAVSMAAEQGVRVLGVSNYYDYTVYQEFAARSRSAAIFPLFGTEIICLNDELVRAGVRINDPANPGKMYICGKGITAFSPMSREAADLLQVIRDKDSLRMREMIAKLGGVFAQAGFDAGLDEAAVKDMVVRRHGYPLETVYLQERHIAQAFQEAMAARLPADEQHAILTRAYGAPPSASVNDAVATQNEIRSRLMKAGKPGYVAETFVDFDHARGLILALRGIPCYPVLADGVTPPCEFEQDPNGLVERLRERNLNCAEFIPERNTPEVLSAYATALRDAGIVITAGTEHNTRDRIPLAPRCLRGAAVPEAVADMFWEGACVVAAHAYRVARGEPGFVDANGVLCAGFANAEARIQALRELGEAVIGAYLRLAASSEHVV